MQTQRNTRMTKTIEHMKSEASMSIIAEYCDDLSKCLKILCCKKKEKVVT